jgi:hypothetical protein
MGMNTILILIAGIVMSTIIASKVAPSIIENIKIKKVENITITNQDTIKEAIYRYCIRRNHSDSQPIYIRTLCRS